MSYLRIFKLANVSFNAICENEIPAKISEFTVVPTAAGKCLILSGHFPHVLLYL